MKFMIFFIFIPLVYSELHTFKTAYTAIIGQTFTGIPEFSAVTTLDDQQIYYYDSNIKKMIPKQNWLKKIASKQQWQEYIEIREKQQQIYRNKIPVLMQRFNQSDGVHTYQRMCGCVCGDETGYSKVFDQHGYDGEDFISLDLKENRYIASVQQATTTAQKWNNDKDLLRLLQQYYDHECVYWLKEFLHWSKATFKKTEPEVSLLQKNPDYYTCHVTGFLFRNTSILWRKNGQALDDSSNLTSGDTLPNEDGTFQRRVTLYVLPEVWRMNQFSCVVEHKSLTETIQKILTEDQIKRSKSASDASYIMYLAVVIITVTVGLIALFVLWKLWKKPKAYSKTTTINSKTKPLPDPAPAQDSQDFRDSLLSNECPSPTEDSYLVSSSLFLQKLHTHSSSAVDQSSQLHPTTESFYTVQETSKDL